MRKTASWLGHNPKGGRTSNFLPMKMEKVEALKRKEEARRKGVKMGTGAKTDPETGTRHW